MKSFRNISVLLLSTVVFFLAVEAHEQGAQQAASGQASDGCQYCVPTAKSCDFQMGEYIKWACGQPGVDCGPLQEGGCCANKSLRTRASYAYNAFYTTIGHCDFKGNSELVTTDPSEADCKIECKKGCGPKATP